jgi:hypothetical protein
MIFARMLFFSFFETDNQNKTHRVPALGKLLKFNLVHVTQNVTLNPEMGLIVLHVPSSMPTHSRIFNTNSGLILRIDMWHDVTWKVILSFSLFIVSCHKSNMKAFILLAALAVTALAISAPAKPEVTLSKTVAKRFLSKRSCR